MVPAAGARSGYGAGWWRPGGRANYGDGESGVADVAWTTAAVASERGQQQGGVATSQRAVWWNRGLRVVVGVRATGGRLGAGGLTGGGGGAGGDGDESSASDDQELRRGRGGGCVGGLG